MEFIHHTCSRLSISWLSCNRIITPIFLYMSRIIWNQNFSWQWAQNKCFANLSFTEFVSYAQKRFSRETEFCKKYAPEPLRSSLYHLVHPIIVDQWFYINYKRLTILSVAVCGQCKLTNISIRYRQPPNAIAFEM